jgi:hypothetical protein
LPPRERRRTAPGADGLGDPVLVGDSVATLVSDLVLSEASLLIAPTGTEVRAAWRLMTVDLVEVATAMRSLSERMAEGEDAARPLQRLLVVSLERVPSGCRANVSMLRGDRSTTSVSTHRALRADVLQYEIGSGPCVDAVLEDSVYVTGDVGAEPRWTWRPRWWTPAP